MPNFGGTRTSKAVIIPLVLAAFAWGSAGMAAPTPPDRKPVSLYLTAETGDKLVRGLSAEDFRLYEDGKPVPFRLEKPETPASVVLLVEYSQRSWLYFNDIQQAMEGFLDVAPEGNWYALATYSHDATIQVDFTKRKGQITEAFYGLGQPLWDDTDTYDAVYDMLDRLGRLPGRRVLIVIGSGLDSYSRHSLGDVEKKIEDTNAIVYGVGAGSLLRGSYEPYLGSSARMDLYQAEAFLKMLADKSGGQAWFPRFETAVPDVMKGIVQSLDGQYKLVYVPRALPDGKFHKIKVEAFQIVNDQRQDFHVRVRKGLRY